MCYSYEYYIIGATAMFQQLLDWLFPRYCFGCRTVGDYLCPTCADGLKRATAGGDDHFAAFDYDQPALKQAIWKLKYSGITSLADRLGGLLADCLLEELAELSTFSGQQNILVVPVPLARGRARKRGYNQSALLAQALVRRLPNQLSYRDDLVAKIKDTPPQVAMKSERARRTNLRGAFQTPRPELLKNHTVLIIDDVVTTGATLDEISRVLQASGATVLTATLARREI